MDQPSQVLFPLEQTEQSIAQRFEAQVNAFPDRPAVIDRDRTFSYTELNVLANRIAHKLASIDGAAGQRVALYMEKGAPYLAGILGVLKAGHAYVPLDPSFPSDRNAYIAADTTAAFVITNALHREGAGALGFPADRIIDLSELTASAAVDADCQNPNLDVSPDALAYIIYTSGSTGKPKGVMQNHRNTLHGCMRRTNLQRVTSVDRMSLFYSCSVMGSVYCIFGALLNGAALLPYDIREEGLADLAKWLVVQEVTIYHSVASVFRQFAENFDGPIQNTSVRLVIFGGERVLATDVEAARKMFSRDVVFFTGLGSTETGTVRYFFIGPDTTLSSRIVPIGHAVEDVEIVLTDESGSPVPANTVGEINVVSRYIALGYWNNEEATKAAFSDWPGAPGLRRYRMGDLAELSATGLLEHRGRRDFQVKIRGFRVEIGEVEAALQSHEALSEGVVKALELGNETQLVAFVVPKANTESLTVKRMREFLKARLPSYMVPTVYVLLPSIPKTPNGKVDKNALPAPLPENALPDEPRLMPGTATERTLVGICAELLRRQEIGTNENFFDLGGDSLNATRLIARIEKDLGVRLPMRAVFAATTLVELAFAIDQAATANDAGAMTSARRAIGSTSRPARIPATPAQRRMWLIDQIHPGSSAYNISNSVRLLGALDALALESALNQLVARHEILRTRFRSEGETCYQEIDAFVHRPLHVTDHSSLPVDIARQKGLELVRAAISTPLSLSEGPLVRFELIRSTPSEHVLCLVFNHIVYDNIWSSRIFFEELGRLYEAAKLGTNAQLAPLPLQFADYSVWEEGRLGGDFAEDLAYFRQELADAPPPPELPGDRPRPARPTFTGGQIAFKIAPHLRHGLVQFTRDESATTFMTLLATWAVLLARYSGQGDVLVGTPTGRRYLSETEGLIGLFINNLVLRSRIGESTSFRELLAQVRRSAIDAFSHDEVPFEELVAELKPARTGGVSPYFQHYFIHRNASNSSWTLPGLAVEPLHTHAGGSKFDLTLSVLENERELSATIEYSADLFDRDTVERLAANFQELLGSALDAPDASVWSLPVAAEPERVQALETFNATRSEYDSTRLTDVLIADWASREPDRVAIIGDGGTLTFGALRSRVEQLAARLRAQGTGPGELVSVCMHRSPELVIALLAVLETGAAYVPLDPEFPADRLEYMVEDSRAAVFLSERSLTGLVRPPHARIVLIDAPEEDPPAMASKAGPRGPADLAYVIYTSGSTGKPKGVQVTHGGLLNFLLAMRERPGITEADVVQSVTTICFDIAGLELFLPLLVGAKVIVSDRQTSLSPDRLQQSLVDHGATILQATPITWRMLLDSGWTGTPKVKILCGGEAMGPDLARRLIETGCEVWNMYGPTETTIWSTVGRVLAPDDAGHVGEPIANTDLYVMNQALALQPFGVPGELLIGGDGVARGYLNRSELTKERFVQSPFNSQKRLYRTGDLVVRRANGRIEFLGRMDNQVKIRGFRVELGEIEAQLSTHPEVKQAVVLLREDTPGDQKLVAYYIRRGASSPEALTTTTLFEHLKVVLPHYMVPSAFVELEAFPQTPNGKIDRKQLPAPARSTAQGAEPQDFGGARHDLDRGLILLWQEILGRQGLSIDDDFFAHGGDSMLALRLVRVMHESLGLKFPLATLFETPTIRALVDRGGEELERAATIVRLNEISEGTPVYCLAGIRPYKPLADRLQIAPVYAVYALREIASIQAQTSGIVVKDRISPEGMAQTYFDAIVRHLQGNRVCLVGHSFGGLMALEVADKLRKANYEVENVVLLDAIPRSAYVRTLAHAIRQYASRLRREGPMVALGDIVNRGYQRVTKEARALAERLRATRRADNLAQGNAFRALRGQFDLTGRHYDFDVLLVKAKRKTFRIGEYLKHDYDFGGAISGKLSIAEVDADHMGMVRGEVADDVFQIVSGYFSARGAPANLHAREASRLPEAS